MASERRLRYISNLRQERLTKLATEAGIALPKLAAGPRPATLARNVSNAIEERSCWGWIRAGLPAMTAAGDRFARFLAGSETAALPARAEPPDRTSPPAMQARHVADGRPISNPPLPDTSRLPSRLASPGPPPSVARPNSQPKPAETPSQLPGRGGTSGAAFLLGVLRLDVAVAQSISNFTPCASGRVLL